MAHNGYTLYGAPGSGALPVHAALTLIGQPFTTVDVAPWKGEAEAPRMAEVVRRVDADPRLAEVWAARFPFTPGWESGEG